MNRIFGMVLSFGLIAIASVIAIEAWAAAPSAKKSAHDAVMLSPPSVKMSVDRDGTTDRWKLRVENTGSVPWRLVADARFLSLDITPPASVETTPTKAHGRSKAPATVHCTLPDNMRPDPEERGLVVPPGRVYSESFDPALYCFGAREAAALIPGAIVTAHLGWHSPHSTSPPFAIEALHLTAPGDPSAIASAKEIVAPPWTIPSSDPVTSTDGSTSSSPQAAPETPDDDSVKLALSLPARADAERGLEISTELTVANEGARTAIFSLRSETISFNVERPDGAVLHCSWATEVSPIRENLTTLPPHARASLSVLVTALCSERNAFALPGLYHVTVNLDTRRASGRSIGVRTFEGLVHGTKPMLLRVHEPLSVRLAPRPTLE
jgi:hypothetical protein